MRPAGAPVILILVVVAWTAALPLVWQPALGPRPIRDRGSWGRGPEPAARAAMPGLVDARAWEDWRYTTAVLERARPWCDWVPRHHVGDIEAWRRSGVDVERFLRGHLYQFEVPGAERHEIDTWWLAQSIHQAGLGRRMARILRSEAGRADLDDYNRYRAAETLVSLWRQQVGPTARPWSEALKYERYQLIRDVRAELETLGLPPAAKDWISSLYFH